MLPASHHGGFPAASRHLAGMAPKGLDAFLLAFAARFVRQASTRWRKSERDSLTKMIASAASAARSTVDAGGPLSTPIVK